MTESKKTILEAVEKLEAAAHEFDSDDKDSPRFKIFAWACLSVAAHRFVQAGSDEALEHFESLLLLWRLAEELDLPKKSFREVLEGPSQEKTFEVIVGGKS